MDLKKMIRAAGYKSQAEFARRNGISANAVSKWLRHGGKVPKWAINQLTMRASIFDVLSDE